jgi:hypothetical protein
VSDRLIAEKYKSVRKKSRVDDLRRARRAPVPLTYRLRQLQKKREIIYHSGNFSVAIANTL